MKLVLAENPDMCNAELVEHMSGGAKIYAKSFVNGNLQNPTLSVQRAQTWGADTRASPLSRNPSVAADWAGPLPDGTRDRVARTLINDSRIRAAFAAAPATTSVRSQAQSPTAARARAAGVRASA